MQRQQRAVAWDLGRTVFVGDHAHDEIKQAPNLDCQWAPGAKELIMELAPTHDQWIISFCGKNRMQRVCEQLRREGMVQYIPEDHWLFCHDNKNKARDKARLMVKHNIDLLVDDNQHIVQACRDVGKQAIQFGVEVADFAALKTRIV